MSRVFLKDLPKYIEKGELLSKFSIYGNVTDIKIISKNKKNIAFIGFQDKNCAQKIMNKYKFFFFRNNKVFLNFAIQKKLQFSQSNHVDPVNLLMRNIKKGHIDPLFEESCEMGKIFVRNLPSRITENDLRYLLKPFGFIYKILILNRYQNDKSSQALVEYGIPECASKAAACLDGKIFRGKILHILPFNKKKYSFDEWKEKGTFFANFRKFKDLSEPQDTTDKRWSFSLFIPREKLIKSLFEKYKIQNKDIDYNSKTKIGYDNIIFSEARIQNELGLILNYTGLNFTAFCPSSSDRTSRRIFFLKSEKISNILDVKKSLKKFGKIVRLLYFSFTNFILVEFQKKKSAESAFNFLKKLITKKKTFIIEWAPLGCTKFNCSIEDSKNLDNKNVNSNPNLVFFRNDKKFLKIKDKKLSFDLCNKNYEFEERGKKSCHTNLNKIETKRKECSYKILVRNLPFQIKIIHLRKIFQNYGTLLSVRLPKKFSGQSKGFAFIEFKDLEDAKRAVLATQNIHLFSRHLVVNLFSK